MSFREKYFKYKTKYLELQNYLKNLEAGSYENAKKAFYEKLVRNYNVVLNILNNDKFLKKQINNDENINFSLPSAEEIILIIARDEEKKTKNKKMTEQQKEKRIEEERKINENTALSGEQKRKLLNELKKSANKQSSTNQTSTDRDEPNNLTTQEFTLNKIFKYFKSIIDSSGIELFIKFYLTENGFGEQNSVENIGRLKDALNIYDRIKEKKKQKKTKKLESLSNFSSLTNLEEYTNKFKKELEESENKKQEQRELQKKIKEEGENDVVTIMDLERFIIYQPTTENGAKYYGRNTKWCTASQNNNMFDYYNKDGPLYIIQSKTNSTDKYQLHFETEQYMDKEDKSVEINLLLSLVNDVNFELFINKNKFYNINVLNALEISNKTEFDKLANVIEKIKIINNNKVDNTYLDLLSKLSNIRILKLHDDIDVHYMFKLIINPNKIKKLNFEGNFNMPLGDSLANLINLENLSFGNKFNMPLGNSLANLINLENLSFGNKFNQKINNSLSNLNKLKHIVFGNDFNIDIENSLNNLVNLESIIVLSKSFRLNSLSELTKLKKIIAPYVDSTDKICFDKLINLEELKIGSINVNDNELSKLQNLKILESSITLQNTNTLDYLDNLEKLTLKAVNIKGGEPFKNLKKLKHIIINGDISCNEQYTQNSISDDIFNGLSNLQILELKSFNGQLKQSLKNLANLETLILSGIYHDDEFTGFNQEIMGAFDGLVNLKNLEMMVFDNKISNSFDKLHKLEYLRLEIYGKKTNETEHIDSTFSKLVNLKVLMIPYCRNLSVDTFMHFEKLEKLHVNNFYENKIDIPINNMKNLKEITYFVRNYEDYNSESNSEEYDYPSDVDD